VDELPRRQPFTENRPVGYGMIGRSQSQRYSRRHVRFQSSNRCAHLHESDRALRDAFSPAPLGHNPKSLSAFVQRSDLLILTKSRKCPNSSCHPKDGTKRVKFGKVVSSCSLWERFRLDRSTFPRNRRGLLTLERSETNPASVSLDRHTVLRLSGL
jgi:hypothetical protein